MKNHKLFCLKIWSCILVSLAAIPPTIKAQDNFITSVTNIQAHPRMFLLNEQVLKIRKNVATDPDWKKLHLMIIKDCDAMLEMAPVERIKIGKRLLDKSRECLRRVTYLSYAYRITAQKKYLLRAKKEMLAVSAFTDWNPSHFLDVAEMTTALAIGYDWLYNDIDEHSRTIIKNAIVKNGIEPSLLTANNFWLKDINNWNQVCNGGMLLGAIATYEDHPEFSQKIINRGIISVQLPMQVYEPDGAYPEGYSYWNYGTIYNVLLINALQTAFKNDFGLSKKDGLIKTGAYPENMIGSTGQPFNYFDSGIGTELNPAVFWFASQYHNPSLLWMEKKQFLKDKPSDDRLLPFALIWGSDVKMAAIKPPVKNMWVGNGLNPVALMRTSWTDPDALFIGIKGGSPSLNHAHMDAGSFVMDADGVRWAMDFGMNEYNPLEQHGVDLWNNKQNSTRWQVFRYNNYAHNTLTINNKLQNVDGKAGILSYSSTAAFMNAIIDVADLYKPMVTKANRGAAIINNSYVVIQDEIETGSVADTIRWSMVTAADAKIINKNTFELTTAGKKLLLIVNSPATIQLKVWPTRPANDYEASNTGTSIIGFETQASPNQKITLNVLLVPFKNLKKVNKELKPLADWPK